MRQTAIWFIVFRYFHPTLTRTTRNSERGSYEEQWPSPAITLFKSMKPGSSREKMQAVESSRMVGTGRFELPTPRTPSECSTRLSHVPTFNNLGGHFQQTEA